jgi:peptidyl-prolyl cis-trans isomerase B (cyclophilin B)
MSDIKITLHTTAGDIDATFYASKAPLTCANFLNLARRGYYNNIAFHRVIEGFMLQGGDPTESGRGGPGYKYADEFHPDLRHRAPGVFSMANAGPGTNGSQFFITTTATPFLDNRHSVFGQVTNGLDVVEKITGKNNTGKNIPPKTKKIPPKKYLSSRPHPSPWWRLPREPPQRQAIRHPQRHSPPAQPPRPPAGPGLRLCFHNPQPHLPPGLDACRSPARRVPERPRW